MKSTLLTLLAAATMTLVSCKTHYHNDAMVAEATGATASGLGQQVRFSEADELPRPTTQAPHAQTYYYAFNKAHIQTADRASILAQARYLSQHPKAHVVLQGHTDERGSREYNVALGERRAKSVLEILRYEGGVTPQQIRIVSYGQEKPAALGHSEAAWKFNRRTELTYDRLG